MNYDESKISAAIDDAMRGVGLDAAASRDVAFHLTDWLADLDRLQRFYADPGHCASDEIADLVLQFLLHAPEHVAAAKKLATGFPVTDVFEVGALDE